MNLILEIGGIIGEIIMKGGMILTMIMMMIVHLKLFTKLFTNN